MKKTLDFICIGAAKSATTTLYELIKEHPDLSLPKAKEVPYFSDDKVYSLGIEKYMKSHFAQAQNDTLWGTITPQYMIGQGDVTPQEVAHRINNDMPEVKIIALLRHPIERSFSHYRMLRRNGHETRSFNDAVNDILNGKTKLAGYDDRDSDYIAASRYGEILSAYYDRFPKKNILVLSTDNLQYDPAGTLVAIFDFLGVDKTYRPTNLKQTSRKGGSRPRIKYLTPGFLYSLPYVKPIWRNRVPQPIRKRIEYAINLWNTIPDNEKLDRSSAVFKKLVAHFKDDVSLLSRLTGEQPYWVDWQEDKRTDGKK